MPETDHLPGGRNIEGRNDTEERRWRLIADVAVFQGKLLADGLRDLVLSPVSLGAALVGIVTSRDDPGRHFYRLMHWGRWSDRAINLFNAKGAPADEPVEAGADGPNIDQLADELERALLERYAQSALAKAAKESIDKGLNRVNSAPAIDRESLRAAARRITRGLERARSREAASPSKADRREAGASAGADSADGISCE